jgi:hypothetical protein
MTKPEDFLAAGGYLAVTDKVKNEASADHISARIYRHSVLGNRPVVRLTADNLAAGEDLTLEFLGFSSPEIVGPLAKRQRQALGFPGWALVNDPKHARYALQLVKGFKQAVRKSKAKPGHGYDEFVETSKQLGSSVAHFLPSFWEQVGREFLALDNSTYASRAFGKAREAEKVHALKVDEATRKDAFLEFALAGAVSIKALTEYGKELQSTHDPKSAWTFFRELCVRRILGGMPPWPSMFKDLQPLIKAADLDLEQETQSILAEIIDSPAISRSATGFWAIASKSIGPLVKTNHHAAGVLLNMIPQSSQWRSFDEIYQWLKYLDAWGILANAWKDNIPAEAGPDGGASAWLARVIRQCMPPLQAVYDLVESMAPRLRSDNVPVDLYLKARWGNRISGGVDLLDLALALRIPITNPAPGMTISLIDWSLPAGEPATVRGRPRDPVHLVADPRFVPYLRPAVEEAAGVASFEAAASGKVALSQARREWLASVIDDLTSGGLPRFDSKIQVIESRASKAMFAEFPEEFERLQQADLPSVLTRTIQAGLLDEFGWPTFEQVYDSFVAKDKSAPLIFGAFPYLILTNKLKAVVLKGNDIVHEAELKLPKRHDLELLLFIDGDLLVWVQHDYESTCFWNSDREPSAPGYTYSTGPLQGFVIDIPEGGTFVGQKIIHRGDKAMLQLRPDNDLLSDGKHWWKRISHYQSANSEFVSEIVEIDPITGNRGRKSMPAFLEDFVEPDSRVELENCSLLPLAEEFKDSLLGGRDGLIGNRVRCSKTGVRRVEGIDGRFLEVLNGPKLCGLIKQPGTEHFLAVESVDHESSASFRLWDPTGACELTSGKPNGDGYSQGQAATLPVMYLHAYQVRDVATSLKFRAITATQVQKLLDAESQDLESLEQAQPAKPNANSKGNKSSKDLAQSFQYPMLDAAIRKLLGSEVHQRLGTGLRGTIIKFAQKTRQLAEIVEQMTPGSSDPIANQSLVAAEAAATPFLSSLRYGFEPVAGCLFLGCSAHVARFFSGEELTAQFPSRWFNHLQILSTGLSERLWSIYCPNPTDQTWILFAEAWADTRFQDLQGYFRLFTAVSDDKAFLTADHAALVDQFGRVPNSDDEDEDDDEDEGFGWAIPYIGKTNRYLIKKSFGNHFEVLQYSTDGNFESISELTERNDSDSAGRPNVWSSDSLRSFVQQAKDRPLNIPPPELLNTVASDVKASAAEVALVWFGLPKFNDYAANFMPAHLREGCKLKTKECSSARESLKAMSPQSLQQLVRSVLSGDPSDLWENPPSKIALRLTAAWRGNQGQRIDLSPEWLEKLTDAVGYGIDKPRFLEGLTAPAISALLSDQGVWSFHRQEEEDMELVCDQAHSEFDADILRATAVSIAMLTYGLPVGDPARNKMGDVYQALLNALKNPGLMLEAGTRYEGEPQKIRQLLTLVEAHVGKPKKQDSFQVADDGLMSIGIEPERFVIAFRPANASTKAQSDRLTNQLAAFFSNASDEDIESNLDIVKDLKLIRSPEFLELTKRISATPVAAGSYESNPIHSAPDVVQQIVKKYRLSEEAAVYYLQLLTLADPTDKNIALWNGWTTATLKKRAGELVGAKLVLEATRSRAGRKYFLPGGWEDLKAPHLPIETWKMPLFHLTRDDFQRATPPLGRILPLEPVHSLFAKAWKRILDGDTPKYEEVK